MVETTEPLVAFVLARLEEARHPEADARTRADLEAKGRIARRWAGVLDGSCGAKVQRLAWATLVDLAALYVRHPDYDDRWRGN